MSEEIYNLYDGPMLIRKMGLWLKLLLNRCFKIYTFLQMPCSFSILQEQIVTPYFWLYCLQDVLFFPKHVSKMCYFTFLSSCFSFLLSFRFIVSIAAVWASPNLFHSSSSINGFWWILSMQYTILMSWFYLILFRFPAMVWR